MALGHAALKLLLQHSEARARPLLLLLLSCASRRRHRRRRSFQPRPLCSEDRLHAGMQPRGARQALPLLLHGGRGGRATHWLQLSHEAALKRGVGSAGAAAQGPRGGGEPLPAPGAVTSPSRRPHPHMGSGCRWKLALPLPLLLQVLLVRLEPGPAQRLARCPKALIPHLRPCFSGWSSSWHSSQAAQPASTLHRKPPLLHHLRRLPLLLLGILYVLSRRRRAWRARLKAAVATSCEAWLAAGEQPEPRRRTPNRRWRRRCRSRCLGRCCCNGYGSSLQSLA